MDKDEFKEQVELSEKGEAPSPYGELGFHLDVEPISQGSSSKTKRDLKKALATACKDYQFLLSGDLHLEIVWFVHEKYRYEYHKAPDLDNIIKPILDSLSGPDGVFIDDTQIQSIGCSWIDWTKDAHRLSIMIKYMPDLWVHKKDLKFIEFEKGLCLPFNFLADRDLTKTFVVAVTAMLGTRALLAGAGYDYSASRAFMAPQRLFHRNKVSSKFAVIRAVELVNT